VTGEQAAFGSDLRRERERQNISLASVAASTKINQGLLASLERGDTSAWPSGIYRRAFLREYAGAIGVPFESILAEFLRLFPESGAAVQCIDPPPADGDLRLTLASEERLSPKSLALQTCAALIDALTVLTIGGAAGALLQVNTWTAAGACAVIYFSLATALLGRSPAMWLTNAALVARADRSAARVRRRPSSRAVLHIVPTNPRLETAGPQYDRLTAEPIEKRSAS